jgi:hypothetical protein
MDHTLISPQISPQNDWISAADINNAARKNTQEDKCDKEQKQAFQSFGHLPNELKLYVLGFAAEVSMDISSNEMTAMYSLQSSLTQHKDTSKPVHLSLTAMRRVESKVGTEVGVGIQN